MRRPAKSWIGITLLAAASFISAVLVGLYFVFDSIRGERLLAEGCAAVQRADCDAAIPKLQGALRTRLPKIQASYAHGNRGYCYNFKAQREEALRDYSEAIRLNPKLAWNFEARGLLYDYMGEPEKALQDYSKAIELDANHAEALYRRGLIHLARQNADLAIADLREAIRARPNTAHFYFSLGDAFWLKEDWATALASFESAIRTNPRDPAAYRKRAALCQLQGETQKAVADNARAQLLQKRMDGTLEQASLGELYREAYWAMESGNPDLAVELYGQLLGAKLSRENASAAYLNRGNAYLALRENEKALWDYNRALKEDPKSAGAYVNRATVALARDHLGAVIADCTEALRLDPALGEAYLNRAMAYAGQEEWAQALADLRKTIALGGKQLEIAFNQLAWIRATAPEKSVRNGKEAVDAATRACELTTWQDPGFVDTLAAAHAEMGDFEKAVQWQTQALTLNKLSPEIRAEMEARLAQYRERKPYRERAKPVKSEMAALVAAANVLTPPVFAELTSAEGRLVPRSRL